MNENRSNQGKKRKTCDKELIVGTNNLAINGSSSSSSNAASPRASKKLKQPVRLVFEQIGNDANNTRAFFSEEQNKMFWNNGAVQIKFKLEGSFQSASLEGLTFNVHNKEEDYEFIASLSDYETQDEFTVGWLNLQPGHTGRVFVCCDGKKIELYFKNIKITDKIFVIGSTKFIEAYNNATEYEQASFITNYAEEVGKGGEAVNYKCYCIKGTHNNQLLMVKSYRRIGVSNAKLRVIYRDAFLLQQNVWKDPDVNKMVPEPIKFFENHYDAICEVHEFISGGSLLDNINSRNNGWYTSKSIMKDHIAKSIFSQLLHIKKTLNKHGVTHRDLSPENFLVQHVQGQLPILYVIDFGHARGALDDLQGVFGKKEYWSPELAEYFIRLKCVNELKEFDQNFVQKKADNLSAGKYNHKTDNFSLGQVLYVALTRSEPRYKEIARLQKLQGIANHIFVNIINGLMLRDPNDRWSADRALACLNNGFDAKSEVIVGHAPEIDGEGTELDYDSTLMFSNDF